MPTWLITTSKWGSVFVILALIVTFLKNIIAFVGSIVAFIGFLTTAIKILIVFVFIALFIGVAFLIYKSFMEKRKSEN